MYISWDATDRARIVKTFCRRTKKPFGRDACRSSHTPAPRSSRLLIIYARTAVTFLFRRPDTQPFINELPRHLLPSSYLCVRFNWHFARVKNVSANRRRVVDARNCRIPNIVGGVFFMQMRPSRRKGRVRNRNRPNCVKLFSSKLHRPPFFLFHRGLSYLSDRVHVSRPLFRFPCRGREQGMANGALAIRHRCWTPERDRRRTFRFVFKGKKRSFFVFCFRPVNWHRKRFYSRLSVSPRNERRYRRALNSVFDLPAKTRVERPGKSEITVHRPRNSYATVAVERDRLHKYFCDKIKNPILRETVYFYLANTLFEIP